MKRILALMAFAYCCLFPLVSHSAPKTAETKSHLTELTYVYFPMAVPISVLGETIRRDRILQRNLARLGFSLTFRQYSKGNDVLEMIKEGKVAAVTFADMPSIEAASTGNMHIAGLVKQSYSAVVSPKSFELQHLKGKRIGNAYGSTSHYALLQALKSAGMKEKDIVLVPMETSQMPEALNQGKIDAFAAWEPVPSSTLSLYPGKYVQINRQVSYSFFLLADKLVIQHQDVAKEITAALIRAINWMRKSSSNLSQASGWTVESAVKFSGKPAITTQKLIENITKSDLLDIAGAPVIPQKLLTKDSLLLQEFDFLKQHGRLPASALQQNILRNNGSRLLKDVLDAPARFSLHRYQYEN